MSKTNQAFERYRGQAENDDILSIYRKGAEVIPINKIDAGLIPLFEGQIKLSNRNYLALLMEAPGIEPRLIALTICFHCVIFDTGKILVTPQSKTGRFEGFVQGQISYVAKN